METPDREEEFFDYDPFWDEEDEVEKRKMMDEGDFWEAYDEAFKPYFGDFSGNNK